MIKVTIELFSINELTGNAKDLVIEEHKNFLIDTFNSNDWDESIRITRSEYAKQLTKSEIIENIEANEYLYFNDGTMAETVLYCGNHPRSGEHILTFKGIEYKIN